MSVVKLMIIRMQSMWQNLDLAIFSSDEQEVISLHFGFKLGVTIQFSR